MSDKERPLEKDVYITEGAPTIDEISEEDRNSLLAELYDSAEGDALANMLDNEDLHDITRLIHRMWKHRRGITLDQTGDLNVHDFRFDLLKMWYKALRRSLTKEANAELEYRHECKQNKSNEE